MVSFETDSIPSSPKTSLRSLSPKIFEWVGDLKTSLEIKGGLKTSLRKVSTFRGQGTKNGGGRPRSHQWKVGGGLTSPFGIRHSYRDLPLPSQRRHRNTFNKSTLYSQPIVNLGALCWCGARQGTNVGLVGWWVGGLVGWCWCALLGCWVAIVCSS